MEKKKTIKPKKTDGMIKISNKVLILEQKLDNVEAGLKLALSRLGLQKEYKNGK